MADYKKMAQECIDKATKVSPFVVEEIYKILRKEHVEKDALAYITDDYDYKKSIEDYSDEEVELADAIAERYVYEGDYDCNLTYWGNIKNLYDDITTSDVDPEISIPA